MAPSRKFSYKHMSWGEFAQALHALDMRDTQFAKLTGINFRHVQNWRQTDHLPPGDKAKKPVPHHARLLVTLFKQRRNIDIADALHIAYHTEDRHEDHHRQDG